MKNTNDRQRVSCEAVEFILRDRPVAKENLRILAEEAKLAFAQVAAGHKYLEAIMADAIHKENLESQLAAMSLPSEIAEFLLTMNQEQKAAFLAFWELGQLRAEAEALGYWRMPN
jgi:hypothetical protein